MWRRFTFRDPHGRKIATECDHGSAFNIQKHVCCRGVQRHVLEEGGPSQRMAEWIANFAGSMLFVLLHLIPFAAYFDAAGADEAVWLGDGSVSPQIHWLNHS